ncbi:MAG: DUF4288 domain-containing protein [Bacteroidia bacterium]
MSNYIAKIIFSIEIQDQNNASQFEEQLRLIQARDENEAFLKARMIGVRGEESFENEQLKMVNWKFIDVAELKKIEEWKDGMEICSTITEREEGERYIHFIQQKAKQIEKRTSQPVLSLN